MHFAMVNESTNTDLNDVLLTQIADALQEQTAIDFSMAYDTLGSIITVYRKLSEVSTIDSILHLVDTIPEASNALAYHTVDEKGNPVLRLGVSTILSNGGTLTKGANSISCACGHEILETIADKYCSQWNDWDGTKKVAYEVCDPVEDQSYEINRIAVPNFVTLEWFDIDVGQSVIFDKLGSLIKPRSITDGGYVAFDDGTQHFGPLMSDIKKVQHKFDSRRSKK